MTQGLFFLVARWALGRSGPIGCDVRRHSGRRLVTATHRKIRNGKFQTEGLFRTIADNLNFRQAAEALYLTQPAVTLQIKALEEELGVALFDRTENSCADRSWANWQQPFLEVKEIPTANGSANQVYLRLKVA